VVDGVLPPLLPPHAEITAAANTTATATGGILVFMVGFLRGSGEPLARF